MKGSLGKDGLVVKQWEVGEDICHLSLDIIGHLSLEPNVERGEVGSCFLYQMKSTLC